MRTALQTTIVVFGVVVAAAGGCATSGGASDVGEFSEEPVAGTPSEEEVRKPWADGPVDSTRPERRGAARRLDDGPAREVEPAGGRVGQPGGGQRIGRLFSDRRIKLDFRQASVRRVLRIFREEARVNLVVAPEVKGRVTISTDEIPLDEAFEAVVRAADLSWKRRENVVVVEPAGGG